MRIVIALGGNAMLQRKQPLEEDIQRYNIASACKLISEVAKEHEVILTHGNGPQVGLLALQNDAYKKVTPYHLDVLGAESEGMIGYLLSQELHNANPDKHVAVLLTQTLVDKNDPDFQNPTKFVGPVYEKEEADKLIAEKGWQMRQDGDYLRRVVPSPLPQSIVEQPSIQYLLTMDNVIVICAGGGGVPVMQAEDGKLIGLEAVVDKDRASNVLAQQINADAFIMLTDVASVETNFNNPDSKKIKQATPEQLEVYDFASGSMGPKVESAVNFVKAGGKFSAIGALTELKDIVSGKVGTRVEASNQDISFYD